MNNSPSGWLVLNCRLVAGFEVLNDERGSFLRLRRFLAAPLPHPLPTPSSWGEGILCLRWWWYQDAPPASRLPLTFVPQLCNCRWVSHLRPYGRNNTKENYEKWRYSGPVGCRAGARRPVS